MYVIGTKGGLVSPDVGRVRAKLPVRTIPDSRRAQFFDTQDKAGDFKAAVLDDFKQTRVLRLVRPGARAVAGEAFAVNGHFGFIHRANFAHLDCAERADVAEHPVIQFISKRGHAGPEVVRVPELGTLFISRGLAYTANFADSAKFADSLLAESVGNRLLSREPMSYFAIIRVPNV